jgi:hypothetical protein
MYNRYVQGENGTYEKYTVPDCSEKHEKTSYEPTAVCEDRQEHREIAQQQNCRDHRKLLGFDLGDLLLLCIVILLVIDSDEDDFFPILIMAAAFLMQQ